MTIGERLKAIREENEESQSALAKALETSQTQITRWETERNEMAVSNLREICRHYGVSADYILGLPKGLKWPR